MQQRLFEITNLLIQRGRITAAELARRFEVSTRTIYRDVDVLSRAGIPVYTERGRDGGIHILPEYVLDKNLFSKDEQREMLAQFESLVSLNTPGSEQLLSKLAALFGRPAEAWLEVNLLPWGSSPQQELDFTLLRSCILQRKIISFAYTGANGTQSQRSVEPQQLVFRGQSWYLRGYCLLRQNNRLFKLTRMHQLQNCGQSFILRPQQHLESTPYSGPMQQIQLRFTASAAFRVYDEFPLESIAPQPDGSLLVQVAFPYGGWVNGFVLSFGADVEVLHPPELRQQISAAVAQLHTMYNT